MAKFIAIFVAVLTVVAASSIEKSKDTLVREPRGLLSQIAGGFGAGGGSRKNNRNTVFEVIDNGGKSGSEVSMLVENVASSKNHVTNGGGYSASTGTSGGVYFPSADTPSAGYDGSFGIYPDRYGAGTQSGLHDETAYLTGYGESSHLGGYGASSEIYPAGISVGNIGYTSGGFGAGSGYRSYDSTFGGYGINSGTSDSATEFSDSSLAGGLIAENPLWTTVGNGFTTGGFSYADSVAGNDGTTYGATFGLQYPVNFGSNYGGGFDINAGSNYDVNGALDHTISNRFGFGSLMTNLGYLAGQKIPAFRPHSMLPGDNGFHNGQSGLIHPESYPHSGQVPILNQQPAVINQPLPIIRQPRPRIVCNHVHHPPVVFEKVMEIPIDSKPEYIEHVQRIVERVPHAVVEQDNVETTVTNRASGKGEVGLLRKLTNVSHKRGYF